MKDDERKQDEDLPEEIVKNKEEIPVKSKKEESQSSEEMSEEEKSEEGEVFSLGDDPTGKGKRKRRRRRKKHPLKEGAEMKDEDIPEERAENKEEII